MRRAARIAVPQHRRGILAFYPREFARFVRIAKGSLSELLDHLKLAVRRQLVDPETAKSLDSLTRRARGACTRSDSLSGIHRSRRPTSQLTRRSPVTSLQEPRTEPRNLGHPNLGTRTPEPRNPEPRHSRTPSALIPPIASLITYLGVPATHVPRALCSSANNPSVI
jgi:hypothetical protein